MSVYVNVLFYDYFIFSLFDSGSHDKMKQKKEKRDEHVEDKRPATHLNERFRYCDRVHLSTPI